MEMTKKALSIKKLEVELKAEKKEEMLRYVDSAISVLLDGTDGFVDGRRLRWSARRLRRSVRDWKRIKPRWAVMKIFALLFRMLF